MELVSFYRMDLGVVRPLGMVCHTLRKMALERESRLVLDPDQSLGTSLGSLVLGLPLCRVVSVELLRTSCCDREQLLLWAALWSPLSSPFTCSDHGSQRSVAGSPDISCRVEQGPDFPYRKNISLCKAALCQTPYRFNIAPGFDCCQGPL